VNRHRAYALPVLMALLLTACTGNGQATQEASQSAGPPTQVEVLVPFPYPGMLRPGLLMAQDRFFAEEGLDVTVTTVDGSSVVAQQLIAGNAIIGLLDVASILTANADGHDVRAVAGFNKGTFSIVVPDDSDVTSVADLEGLTLGVTDLSGGEMNLVRAALADAGLEQDVDVTILAVGEGGPASFLALQDGTVDAFAGAINDFVALESEGLVPRVIVAEKYQGLPAGNWVVMQSTLDDPELRDTVIRVIRAHAKGLVFADENIDAAVAVGCQIVPEQCEDQARAKITMTRGLDTNRPNGDSPWGFNDHDAWTTTQDTLLTDVPPFDVTVAAPNDLSAEINDFDEAAVRAAARDAS
jgi:NitT/TauT family transport system substrate-binding protein